MKKLFKKSIACLIAVLMVVSSMPFTALTANAALAYMVTGQYDFTSTISDSTFSNAVEGYSGSSYILKGDAWDRDNGLASNSTNNIFDLKTIYNRYPCVTKATAGQAMTFRYDNGNITVAAEDVGLTGLYMYDGFTYIDNIGSYLGSEGFRISWTEQYFSKNSDSGAGVFSLGTGNNGDVLKWTTNDNKLYAGGSEALSVTPVDGTIYDITLTSGTDKKINVLVKNHSTNETVIDYTTSGTFEPTSLNYLVIGSVNQGLDKLGRFTLSNLTIEKAYEDISSANERQVFGNVTIDPIVYIHGEYSGSLTNGDKYDYMTFGDIVSDGSYSGECQTNVSSTKNITSVEILDTSNGSVRVDHGILKGHLGGGYASETSFTTNSTLTLKFNFDDDTFEYHKLAVKPNPVERHFVTGTFGWHSTGYRRLIAYQVRAIGSYSNVMNNATASINGNTSDAAIYNEKVNFASIYEPFNSTYRFTEGGFTGAIPSTDVGKIGGTCANYFYKKDASREVTFTTSDPAIYYLDLSSSNNRGITHTASTTDNSTGTYSFTLGFNNVQYFSNNKDSTNDAQAGDKKLESFTTTKGSTVTQKESTLPNTISCGSKNSSQNGSLTLGGTAVAGDTIEGVYKFTYGDKNGAINKYYTWDITYFPFKIYVSDKTAVRKYYNDMIDNVKSLDSRCYSTDTWNVFSNALLDVEEYLNDNTDTSTKSTDSLKEAYEGLTLSEDFENDHPTATKNTIAPTCTDKGYDETICGVCGKTKKDNFTDALGHDLQVVADSAQAPTCTEAGKEADKACSRCDYTETGATISATGHHLTETVAKNATCTEAGNRAYWTCSTCNKMFSDADATMEITEIPTISATGHHLTETVAKNATCTEAGNSAYWTCSDCGKMFSDAEATIEITEIPTIPALGHDYDVEYNAETNVDVFTCKNCKDTYSKAVADMSALNEAIVQLEAAINVDDAAYKYDATALADAKDKLDKAKDYVANDNNRYASIQDVNAMSTSVGTAYTELTENGLAKYSQTFIIRKDDGKGNTTDLATFTQGYENLAYGSTVEFSDYTIPTINDGSTLTGLPMYAVYKWVKTVNGVEQKLAATDVQISDVVKGETTYICYVLDFKATDETQKTTRVRYLDKTGNTIEFDTAEVGSTYVPKDSVKYPNLPYYVFDYWECVFGTPENVGTREIVFKARYKYDETTLANKCTIQGFGNVKVNGESSCSATYDSKVTLTGATKYAFCDENQNIISYINNDYIYTPHVNNEIVYIIGVEEEAKKATTAITGSFVQKNAGKLSDGITDYHNLYVNAQYYLPEGTKAVEAGIVISKSKNTADDLQIGKTGVTKLISETQSPNHEYSMAMSFVNSGSINVRSYLICVDGSGNTYTVYSAVKTIAYSA